MTVDESLWRGSFFVSSLERGGLLIHHSNKVLSKSGVMICDRGIYYFIKICKLLEW